ncbi:MAG: hypothetical protein ACI4BC_06150 [Muribaculaceae bacterium]
MTKGEVIRHPGGGGRLSVTDCDPTAENGGTQCAATDALLPQTVRRYRWRHPEAGAPAHSPALTQLCRDQ